MGGNPVISNASKPFMAKNFPDTAAPRSQVPAEFGLWAESPAPGRSVFLDSSTHFLARASHGGFGADQNSERLRPQFGRIRFDF